MVDPVVFKTKGCQKAAATFWRPARTNFYPTKAQLTPDARLVPYAFRGWLPPSPFIEKNHRITAFGSCFAARVSAHLARRGYRVMSPTGARPKAAYVITYGAGLNNTFVVRQQFEWALEGREFPEVVWHDKKAVEVRPEEAVRKATAELFRETDVFIITLGLSEVWKNLQTGDVFWRAVPGARFDKRKHGFMATTVEQNRQNLETIVRLIRQHLGEDRAVIFTVSPIPLKATFRSVSCLTANQSSKATLRAAVDELMRMSDDPRLFYFPSYDLVAGVWGHTAYQADNRHLKPNVVDRIMGMFERHYCRG